MTRVAINGEENPQKAEVPFVFDGGEWKIEKVGPADARPTNRERDRPGRAARRGPRE